MCTEYDRTRRAFFIALVGEGGLTPRFVGGTPDGKGIAGLLDGVGNAGYGRKLRERKWSMDTDQFIDEGNKEAGLDVNVEVDEAPPAEETAAEETAEKAVAEGSQESAQEAAEKTAEQASDDRSFLVPETQQQQEAETTVPLHVVTKLRQEKRDLKQQLDQANTRPAGEKADVVPDPLAALEDDDFLTAGQARAERVRNQAIGEQVRQETEQQSAQAVQQEKFKGFLLESEKQAKADHSDYSAVMTAAEDYMSPDEFQAALRTKNPAKVLYAKAKQTIATLGIEVQAPVATKQKETQSREHGVAQTDQEVFDEVFPAT